MEPLCRGQRVTAPLMMARAVVPHMLRAGGTGRRFLAVHWDTALPPAEAAEKCVAPIAWKSIATMPIEPD